MRLRHLSILAPALVLSACAAHEAAAPSAQVDTLRAELERMRARTDALENRIELLENQQALRDAGRRGQETAPTGQVADGRGQEPAPTDDPAAAANTDSGSVFIAPGPGRASEIPALTVVKLKPSTKPAPKLDTTTPVVEPDPEVVEALAQHDAASSASNELAQAEYERGLQDLRTGNLQNGVDLLRTFAEKNPEHPLADNALYFVGIGEIGLEEYEKGADAFATVIARYPAGDAVAEAMLKLADCRVHLHQRDDARSLFARVVSTYPGTAAAAQAEQRLASLSP